MHVRGKRRLLCYCRVILYSFGRSANVTFLISRHCRTCAWGRSTVIGHLELKSHVDWSTFCTTLFKRLRKPATNWKVYGRHGVSAYLILLRWLCHWLGSQFCRGKPSCNRFPSATKLSCKRSCQIGCSLAIAYSVNNDLSLTKHTFVHRDEQENWDKLRQIVFSFPYGIHIHFVCK